MNNSRNFLKYLMASVLLVSFSCEDKVHEKILIEQENLRDSINKTPAGKASKIEYHRFETLNYEGCEYLVYKEHPTNNTAMGFMAHKGNCKNIIHCKTEQKTGHSHDDK